MTQVIVTPGTASFEEFMRVNALQENQVTRAGLVGDQISEQINNLIINEGEDYLVLATSDVVFPDGWIATVSKRIEDVVSKWQNCVALTAVGIAPFQHGYSAAFKVDHLIEAGYESVSTVEIPVTSSSDEFVLVDLARLRSRFPGGFKGFLTADFQIWFCLELALAGLNVIASPAMSTYVPNRRRLGESRSLPQKELIEFVGKNINCKEFLTTRGKVRIPLSQEIDLGRLPPSINNLILGSLEFGQELPSLAIVTRTQFKRPHELNRCLDSVQSFAAQYNHESLKLVLVSDSPVPDWLELPDDFNVVTAQVRENKDSRFILVGEVVKRIDSDYYLFVDDDDWMFPNHADSLRLILSTCPQNSVIFADARHYSEEREDGPSIYVGNNVVPGRFFPGSNFPGSLTGVNKNPFCAVVFPRVTFDDLTPDTYSGIEYAEDYFLILRTLYLDTSPFVLPGELVGISIRESGNTVTEFGHIKWLRAKANVAQQLANGKGIASGKFLASVINEESSSKPLIQRIFRVLLDGRLLRFAIQSDVIGKVLRGEVSLRYVLSKVSGLVKRGW
jgi:hypothetical protein